MENVIAEKISIKIPHPELLDIFVQLLKRAGFCLAQVELYSFMFSQSNLAMLRACCWLIDNEPSKVETIGFLDRLYESLPEEDMMPGLERNRAIIENRMNGVV